MHQDNANHSLAIDNYCLRCSAITASSGRMGLQRVLDRLFEKTLQQTLPAVLEPLFNEQDGVIRIRKLSFNIDHIGEFDAQGLAQKISTSVLEALRKLLATRPPGLMQHWPTVIEYHAAYINYRLALVAMPAPQWAFSDFTTLDHLPAQRAAAEMIVANPALLSVLASSGNTLDARTNTSFAWALEEPAGTALLEALIDDRTGECNMTMIQTMLPALSARYKDRIQHRPASTIVAVTLEYLAKRPYAPVAQTIISAVIAAIVVSESLFQTITENEQTRSLNSPDPHDQSIARLSTVTERLRKLALTAIAAHQLDHSLQQLHEQAVLPVTSIDRSDEFTTRTDTYFSESAGIGLLLTTIRLTQLHHHLSTNQLHESLKRFLPGANQDNTVADAVFNILFPQDHKQETDDFPPLSETLDSYVAPESQHLIGGSGAERWASFLLAAFASRLPGLRGSTSVYLLRQFVNVPGQLQLPPAI